MLAKSISHRSETLFFFFFFFFFFPIPQRRCQQTVVSTMGSVRGAKWIPSSHRERPEVGRLMVLRPGLAPRTSPLRDCYVQMRPEIKRLQTEPHSAQRQGTSLRQVTFDVPIRKNKDEEKYLLVLGYSKCPKLTPLVYGLVPSA